MLVVQPGPILHRYHLITIDLLSQFPVLGVDLAPLRSPHFLAALQLVSLWLIQEVDDLLFVALRSLDHLFVEQLIQILVLGLEVIDYLLQLGQLLLHSLGLVSNLLGLVQLLSLLLDDGHQLLVLQGSFVELFAEVHLVLIKFGDLGLVSSFQLIV